MPIPDITDKQRQARRANAAKARAAKTGQVTVRPGGDPLPEGSYHLQAEAAREKHWRANIAELEYQVRRGELVPAVEVEETYVAELSAARTKLLGVAKRVRQRLPHLDVKDVEIIHELVREALSDLAAS